MTQQYSNVLMLQNSLNKKLSNNKRLLIKGQTFFYNYSFNNEFSNL